VIGLFRKSKEFLSPKYSGFSMKIKISKPIRILLIGIIIVTPISVGGLWYILNLNSQTSDDNNLYPINPNSTNTTFLIPMRDGVKLATDIYLPDENGSFPVVFYRTPYNKTSDYGNSLNFLDRGIASVVQDHRGCFASEGEYTIFGSDGRDANDTVEWMKKQSWFNGLYATYGGSARGLTQYQQVPHLDDLQFQYIVVATPNLFSHGLYQGGAIREMLIKPWLASIGHPDTYYQELFPVHLKSDPWTDDYIIDSWEWGNVTWPSIHLGGWYDIFNQGIVDGFMGYQYHGGTGGAGHAKLIMGPWTHHTFSRNAGELLYPENAARDPRSYKAVQSLIDEKLLGINSIYGSFDEMPNVTYYIMGDVENYSDLWNRWATSEIWPVIHNNLSLYLLEDNSLGLEKSDDQLKYSYYYDPTNPLSTLGGANLSGYRGPYDQRSCEETRTDLIEFNYTITEPLLISGRVWANLYITSNCTDTDFTVKLCDIYPDGRKMLISDGIIRARFREGMESEKLLDGTNQTIYELYVDLWSTCYRFSPGHTLSITISSSNYPRFDANSNTGDAIVPFDENTSFFIANNSILVDSSHPSRIILPVPIEEPDFVPLE
jgi:uncharacterized protein